MRKKPQIFFAKINVDEIYCIKHRIKVNEKRNSKCFQEEIANKNLIQIQNLTNTFKSLFHYTNVFFPRFKIEEYKKGLLNYNLLSKPPALL